jgi:hypothetical protein
MAARGAGAATRADAADWRADWLHPPTLFTAAEFADAVRVALQGLIQDKSAA